MFVGHGLLAFALVAAVSRALDVDRERAVGLGVLAAGFATVPDVDMVYPALVLAADPVGLADAAAGFWSLSTVVHRTATHSLLVGGAVGLGIAAVARWRRSIPGVAALVGLAGTSAVVAAVGGALAGAVVGLAILVGLALAAIGTRAGYGPGAVGAVALVGLLSHPFGDLFTGQPPPLLYPLEGQLLTARVTLAPDPTVHLVGAFLIELATVWLALAVLARLYDVSLREAVRPRAVAGLGYAGAALVLPAPTLGAATGFVFSVLAVGLVGVPVGRRRAWTPVRAVATALAAVTLAALAYGAAYVLL